MINQLLIAELIVWGDLPGELGDQPGELGTLAGMVKSQRGSLKIFLEHSLVDNLSMCVCHRRFSSINIPSHLTEETCSIGTLSIESSSGFVKVLNFCLEPIGINSVLELFKVSLLEISHLFKLSKS